MKNERPLRALVIFGTVALYGMERGVIEIFDLLRPEVEPLFLLSQTPRRLGLPVLDEIIKHNLPHVFFSDVNDWERPKKPQSLKHFMRIAGGVLRGNLDTLKHTGRQDMIYLASPLGAIYSCLAIIWLRLTRRRVLFHFHDLFTKRSRLLRVVSLFATDLIHNTELGRKVTLGSNPFLRRKRSYVIPYPISDPTESQGAPAEPVWNGRKNILFLGQVSKHKGIDILLDAFQQISSRRNNITLDIVGGCDDPDLEKQLKQTEVENGCKVQWWGYQQDTASFLKQAYLYVQPSPPSRFHESFGIGVMEAMAFGIPAVCFRSGALAELMIDGQTGLICEDEGTLALSSTMNRFLADEEFRNNCGQRARQHYQEKYARSSIKAGWLSALKFAS